MGLQKLILNFFLKIVDLCTFWVQQDPLRITFVSLTQDHLTSDFFYIDEALKKEGMYRLDYNLMVFKKNLWGDFQYFLNCLKQVVLYKKSALVILNDNNYVISHCKPKNTKVLQVWHACGAVKKFGNEIKRQYPIHNYDAILANSPYWKPIYASSFDVHEDQVHVTGMARTDVLFDQKKLNQKKEAFYQKYPQCIGKKIILYAPTFRGNIIDGLKSIPFHYENIENELQEYILLYKFHPLLSDIKIDSQKAIDCHQEDLYTLFAVSDCLISDYSSIIFDYSLLNKPMIAFVPDEEEYGKTIGFNLDLKRDFPGSICHDEQEVLRAVYALDTSKLPRFKQKFMPLQDGKNIQRIIQCIHDLL